MIKKISILTFCLLFISCFVEPKKTQEGKNKFDNLNSKLEVDLNLLDTIEKSNIHQRKIDTLDLAQNTIKNSHNKMTNLDKIYLGTNLFHEGSGGTWGKATITKKYNYYWIVGEHKMTDGDWIKIEGKIINPSIESFIFVGKIVTYSPSAASELNNSNYLKESFIAHKDTCVWSGKTVAHKLFENRKYWRIRAYDCYRYGHDVDIFHN